MTAISRKVICTIGPTSLKPKIVHQLQELGTSLFRINLSHTALEKVRESIAFLQKHSVVPVCIDSEGAQIRTGGFVAAPTNFRKDSLVQVKRQTISGDASHFSLTPSSAIGLLKRGDVMTIDFHSVVGEVVELETEYALLRIRKGGSVGNNKACNVHRHIELPAITPKDRAAIEIAPEMGVRHFALSFANSPADVSERCAN